MDTNLSNILGKIRTAQLLKGKKSAVANIDKNTPKQRLPPGQRLLNNENDFPILDLGIQPEFDKNTYRFKVTGLVENQIDITFDELLKKFPKTEISADFHCVTRWSKFDVKWGGIKFKDLIEFVKPLNTAKFVIQIGLDNYSTNVPLEDLMKDNVILAYELYGKPLSKEHGGPVRLIIPELYAWKGSKFLYRLHFKDKDEQGFWEVRGYNNHGDPWKEERYSD